MTRKAMKTAESLAVLASRRRFLKRVSRCANRIAVTMAGFLLPTSVLAEKQSGKKMCCVYISRHLPVFYYRCINGNKCPKHWRGAYLYGASEVSDCAYC
jgi:hypothetical protein